MPDMTITHRPALAGARSGLFGRIGSAGPGVRMEAKPEGGLLHVLGAPDCGDLGRELSSAGLGDARFAGPGQWFLVSDVQRSSAEAPALPSDLAGKAAICDQSHGRVRIALSGANVASLLAKGTAIDLDAAVFPPGRSAMTLLGHISINLARTGADAFELTVLRSFAESLWNDIIHMGLEFGIECVACDDAKPC